MIILSIVVSFRQDLSIVRPRKVFFGLINQCKQFKNATQYGKFMWKRFVATWLTSFMNVRILVTLVFVIKITVNHVRQIQTHLFPGYLYMAMNKGNMCGIAIQTYKFRREHK